MDVEYDRCSNFRKIDITKTNRRYRSLILTILLSMRYRTKGIYRRNRNISTIVVIRYGNELRTCNIG
jgi:hypothetical protein